MERDTFDKAKRGISAPNDGYDTHDFGHNRASYCENCGHVGHKHDKKRVSKDGRFHYRYVCPE